MAFRSDDSTHSLFGVLAETPLQKNSRQDQSRNRGQRNIDQRPCQPPEQYKKQKEKRQVRNRRNSRRGQQFAHLLNIAQLRDERTCRRWSGTIAHPERMTEHHIRHLQVGTLAEHIDDAHSRATHHEIEADCERDTAEQHIKRIERLCRDNTVIDLHRENDARQSKHIGDKGSDHHMTIGAEIPEDDPPQPVFLEGLDIGIDTRIGHCPCRTSQQNAPGLRYKTVEGKSVFQTLFAAQPDAGLPVL
jgi:hypothetical protein